MQILNMKLIGVTPLLIHSDHGADPLNPATRKHSALTSKQKKTPDDHLAIALSEFHLCFYSPAPGVVIPGQNVKSALTAGGKLNKLGASFNRGVMILDSTLRVLYDGPQDHDAMWADPERRFVDCRSVKLGQKRLYRYRPKLPDWTIEVTVNVDEAQADAEKVVLAMQNAGRYVGLGDYRPACSGTFGRFNVEVLK